MWLSHVAFRILSNGCGLSLNFLCHMSAIRCYNVTSRLLEIPHGISLYYPVTLKVHVTFEFKKRLCCNVRFRGQGPPGSDGEGGGGTEKHRNIE